MADGGAPDAWELFGSTQMVLAIEEMGVLRRQFRGTGDPRSALLAEIMIRLGDDLRIVALRTAEIADKAIKARLAATQRRPETSHAVHLRDTIKSEPFAAGGVLIARIDALNKAVNPESNSDKPYWYTQEVGSVAAGNPMTGRVLFGKFAGPGHYERPMAEYRGQAGAPGSEFYFGQPGGGYGTIEHEIEGRHFLQHGADAAWAYYLAAIERLAVRYAAEVTALIAVP